MRKLIIIQFILFIYVKAFCVYNVVNIADTVNFKAFNNYGKDHNFSMLPYRLYIPKNYNVTKKYPLVVFLHGSGQMGNDNKKQISFTCSMFFGQDSIQAKQECFIVVPQAPDSNQYSQWVNCPDVPGYYNLNSQVQTKSEKRVLTIIDSLKLKYAIDTARLYITGTSIGGFGTWDLIMRYPKKFAAAIAVCGGGDPTKGNLIKDIPTRIYHGGADNVVPVVASRKMDSAMRANNAIDVKYTEYENSGHGIWDAAYFDTGLSDWLFSKGLYLKVSENNLNLAANNNSSTFKLFSNTNWSITCNQTWLNIATKSGTNDAIITITPSQNNANITRSATITISGSHNTVQTITIIQEGQLNNISVSTDSIKLLPTAAGTTSFNITSNINWTIENNVLWVTPNITSGSNDASIVLNYSKNTAISARETTLKVIGSNLISRTVYISQQGASPYLDLSNTVVQLPAIQTQAVTIDINTNTSWSIINNLNWISVTPSTGQNNQSIEITATANTTGNIREGIITIECNGIKKNITLTQDLNSNFLKSNLSDITLGAGLGCLTSFTINSNVNWSISSDVNWLSFNPDQGTNNATIIVSGTPNPYNKTWPAEITITANGVVPVKVNLTQEIANISISKSSLLLKYTSSKDSFIITSNTDWSITSDKTWINLSKLNGKENDTIVITATENKETSSRIATLTIKGTGYIDKTIEISQEKSPTAIIEQEKENYLTIYPNPVKNILFLNYSAQFNVSRVKIYNIIGLKVFEKIIVNPKSQLNLNFLDAGIYTLEYSIDNKSIIKRITKF